MSFFNRKKKNKNAATEAEAIQQEILNEEKQDMIQGVEDLSKTSVKEVMIPRIDVDFISSDTPRDELIEKIVKSGHSRFPVYTDSIDNVIGVLYVKDLLKSFAENLQTLELSKIIRKPYFVPESKRIDSLLREFKRHHLHIAIAIDEYGGISGIVTMEDIIRVVFGRMTDENSYDNLPAEDKIKLVSFNTFLVPGEIKIEELNEYLGLSLESESMNTIGGWVLERIGLSVGWPCSTTTSM